MASTQQNPQGPDTIIRDFAFLERTSTNDSTRSKRGFFRSSKSKDRGSLSPAPFQQNLPPSHSTKDLHGDSSLRRVQTAPYRTSSSDGVPRLEGGFTAEQLAERERLRANGVNPDLKAEMDEKVYGKGKAGGFWTKVAGTVMGGGQVKTS